MGLILNSLKIDSDSFPITDVYPFCLDVLRKTAGLRFEVTVTFFIGENGTGKSTLLRAMARACGIHIWRDEGRSSYHHNQYAEDLCRFLSLEWSNGKAPGSFFASEIFQYFSEYLDEWAKADPLVFKDFGGDSLLVCSHGQRHMQFFQSRYEKPGIYFLDEPENALSPKRQIELLGVLREFADRGKVQFFIATHSPILLAFPGAVILSFDSAPITRVEYEDTDYFRIYREFLNDRGPFIRK